MCSPSRLCSPSPSGCTSIPVFETWISTSILTHNITSVNVSRLCRHLESLSCKKCLIDAQQTFLMTSESIFIRSTSMKSVAVLVILSCFKSSSPSARTKCSIMKNMCINLGNKAKVTLSCSLVYGITCSASCIGLVNKPYFLFIS
jgi:hypothetical protein